MANNFVKGLVTGAALGVAVSTMVNPPDNKDIKRINNGAGKAWATIGSVIDGVVGTFR